MISRRNFLKLLGGAALTAAAPSVIARPKLWVPEEGERILRFQNIHTGEKLAATYWADGQYNTDELAALNHLLRDHRSHEEGDMDRRLYDLLYALQSRVENHGRFEVISGYRSPASNAILRQADHTGVAKKSFHMRGRAMDIRLPGVELKHLRQAAMSLKGGGVGYYPKSNFIHVDTGRTRYW